MRILLLIFVALSTCSLSGTSSPSRGRYLLYDVNPGEGFNLRRDVYMRMANLVKLTREEDTSWVLVLPPWANLYHWRSQFRQERLQWSLFFDVKSLAAHVPVLEFVDFLSEVGEARIEKFYQLQNDEEFFRTGEYKEVIRHDDECTSERSLNKVAGTWRGFFWGYSDTVADSFSCVSVTGDIVLFSRHLLEEETAHVVMLARAEVLTHGPHSEWSELWWRARRSMRFSEDLVQIATQFRSTQLSCGGDTSWCLSGDWRSERREAGQAVGGDYVAVHWRRTDFAVSRRNETASPVRAATQLRNLLVNNGLTILFVATDTLQHEFDKLKVELNEFNVVRYTPTKTNLNKYKDGGVAIVDQLICAGALVFVGTYQSTFSFRIQEERELLGFTADSTYRRLCGDGEQDGCVQPTHWPAIYPGEGREFHDEL